MLPKTGKNRKLTTGSCKVEHSIGDLVKNQLSGVMGGEKGGGGNRDSSQHKMKGISLGREQRSGREAGGALQVKGG